MLGTLPDLLTVIEKCSAARNPKLTTFVQNRTLRNWNALGSRHTFRNRWICLVSLLLPVRRPNPLPRATDSGPRPEPTGLFAAHHPDPPRVAEGKGGSGSQAAQPAAG
jgi:hypothetical protein